MRNPAWQWDELVLACALVVKNNWRELREPSLDVRGLSDLLQILPLVPFNERGENFRSPGSVSRKTTDLATAHPSYQGKPTRGGRLDKEVVNAFLSRQPEMLAAAERLEATAAAGKLPADGPGLGTTEDDFAAPEGALLARMHLLRERDPRLRQRKIAAARAAHGTVACSVCDFDFARAYGKLGEGYIEVHHVVPLHVSGETITSLDDLALLCANCHRMCHRSVGSAQPWRSPAELRAIMQAAY